ncbi:Type 1 glutamine amidotransferase-like domain-containing protein [Eisenbergiella sp.]
MEISTATNLGIVNKLGNNDYIYVAGGNTFFLLQEIRNFAFNKNLGIPRKSVTRIFCDDYIVLIKEYILL